MILDGQLKFSAAQAITAAAASQNAIDLSEARNIGIGKELYVVLCVDVAFTHGGSCTGLQVFMYGDSTSSFTPDGSDLLFTMSPTSAAGSGPHYGKVPPSLVSAEGSGNYEYLELYYNPVGASLTAGTVTSYLVADIAAFVAYAKGYTIS